MTEESLIFNGINGATGSYLLPEMTPQQISKIAQGEELEESHLKELRWYYENYSVTHVGLTMGISSDDSQKTGWGVIFAHDADPAIREALSELLDHRKAGSGDLYREYSGADGYHYDRAKGYFESKTEFLTRHHAGPGPVNPRNVPYYLLIVGDPETIPYRFQYQMDVQYAVGRIHFDRPEHYAQYARSVVEAEKRDAFLPPKALFFGVRNQDDPATNLSAEHLIKPLAESMEKHQPNWSIRSLLEEQATKANLQQAFGGEHTPALLFSASHGMGFPNGDPRQIPHQGALLCQDWPGPRVWRESIPEEYYFSADDVADDARLLGSIAFHFACYGAGTPRLDDFAHRAFKERTEIAPRAFIAGLPQRLLSHPKGGALAVVGHVERAWGYSFMWQKAGTQLAVFESTLQQLMEGHSVGSAVEYFNERYAELSTVLSAELEDLKFGKKANDLELSGMWTANNDARSYVIIGDPAVRLPVGGTAASEATRPTIETITLQTAQKEETAMNETIQPPEQPEMNDIDYGVLDSLKKTKAKLTKTLQTFAEKLGKTLEQAVDDISTLEVTTYVSEDMAGVTYDYKAGQFTGGAKLRAMTRIELDGDMKICLPEQQGELDQKLLSMHTDMVKQAQANRTEFFKTLVSTSNGVLQLLKGL